MMGAAVLQLVDGRNCDTTRADAAGAMPTPPFALSTETTSPSTAVPCPWYGWLPPEMIVMPAAARSSWFSVHPCSRSTNPMPAPSVAPHAHRASMPSGAASRYPWFPLRGSSPAFTGGGVGPSSM